MDKSPDAFRTISEVAEGLDLPQHVLRFWESRFPQIKPLKRGGGRRYYRPDDVELLRAIKQLLYGEGYTIKGVQRLFKEQGVRAVASSKLAGASDFAAGDSISDNEGPLATPVADENAPPLAGGERTSAANGRSSLSPVDLQTLQTALADILEGERILSLARAG